MKDKFTTEERAPLRPAAIVASKNDAKVSSFQNERPAATVQRRLQEMANHAVGVRTSAPVQRQENKTGLPDNLKSGIENLSGLAMDDVRVHRNSDKPAQLNAHAYAQGTDIHLAPGQEQHLPHEAWHVVQQKQGRVQPTRQMKGKVGINDDAGLEREADVMGSKAKNSHLPLQRRANTSLSTARSWPTSTLVMQRVGIDDFEDIKPKLISTYNKFRSDHEQAVENFVSDWFYESIGDHDGESEGEIITAFKEFLAEHSDLSTPTEMVEKAKEKYVVDKSRFINVKTKLTESWWFDHFTVEGYAENDDSFRGPVYAHAQLSQGSKGALKNYYLQLTPDGGVITDEPKNQAQKNLSKSKDTWQPGEIPGGVKSILFPIVRSYAYKLRVE